MLVSISGDVVFKLSFIILFFLISGCSSNNITMSSPQPAWLHKPNLHGKTGAVGSSRPQFKGKTVQRRVATSRALDELAQQSGVEVGNIIIRKEERSTAGARFSTEVQSTQRAAGVTINAHIQEVWTDPKTKEMYIWLVAD